MSNKLRTDAALRRAIEQLRESWGYLTFEVKRRDIVINFWDGYGTEPIAELSLNDVIAKRASLRGVNARLKSALRTPKKKKVSKKRK